MAHGLSGNQNKEAWGEFDSPLIIMAKINEETEITITLKSLIAFLALVLTFVVTYFETMEELHMLQKEVAILQDDMEEIGQCNG